MSIIIRLQNLPLSAKSGDIRHFFGGLRIPNGGVHIVGGEKGDAFIAFESDEDARIGMRKDGGKLMGCRVKLYLSSYMEMKHEIERITKEHPDDADRLSPLERLRRRSPPRVRERSLDNTKHYRSDSPMRNRGAYHTGRGLSPHSRRSPRLRSRSPGFRSRSPRMRSRSPRLRSRSPRMRSRSPRRRSRSPHMHGSRRSRSPLPRRSISPIPRSVSLRRSRSVSPYRSDATGYKHSFYESENGGDRNSYRDERISKSGEYFKREGKSVPEWINKDLLKEETAQLEKRIAEVLKTGFDAIKKNDAYNNMPISADVPYSGPSLNSFINPTIERGIQGHIGAYPAANVNINTARSFPPPNINYINPPQNISMNNERFINPPPPILPITSLPPPPLPITALPPMNIPPPMQMPVMPPPPPVPVPNLPPPAPMPTMPPPLPGPPVDVSIPIPGFYITISGLDPNWNFNEVQEMLKGTFVPLNNIKWEIDDHGLKTGTAFIKLSIPEDFSHILHYATYVYNGRLITVSECPNHVVHRYFLPEWPPKGPVDASQSGNLYYRLKGLPYTVTYDEIMQFFQGLDIADIYIERQNELATGIGYIGFNTIEDYQEAYKLNGKTIGKRFIHMLVSCKKSMLKLKKKRGDLLSQSRVLIPSVVASNNPLSDVNPSSQRRPLCILLTGLPPDVTPSRIKNFFKDAGPVPDAIHVTLNDKGRPNCRAYAEFNSVPAFDAALKCHGTNLDGKILCVKQILFDEMEKILNTQRAMHCFEKPHGVNAREKMPNMWQSPDVNRGPRIDIPPSDDNYGRMPGGLDRSEVQVFEYGNQSREPTAVQANMPYEQDNSFDFHRRQNRDSGSFRGEKWPLPSSSMSSRGRGDLFNVPKHQDSDTFSSGRFAPKVEDFESNRGPVKFEVKTKQPMSKKSELSDAFDRSLKPEFKKKLTKLSPEKSSAPETKPTSGKNEKNFKGKKAENSTKVSSDRNVQKKDGKKAPDEVSAKSRNENSAGRGGKYDPKFKSRSIEKKRDDAPYKIHPRSPSPEKVRSRNRRSRSLSPYSHDMFSRSDPYFEDDEREAVVQISNVDPILKGPELADFLHGFDVNHDKIIRRIERGKPAWDIRVTFLSYREAERAIRFLNGSFINGVPVDMFFVD